MGPCSHHTAQEGEAFCLLEMNVVWCEKCKSIPEQQQLTMWRCWRKQPDKYLYPQQNKFCINRTWKTRNKPRLQKRHRKARQQFARSHVDKDHRYVWRKQGETCKPMNNIPTVNHEGGSSILWRCFAAGGTGARHKIDGVMRNCPPICANILWLNSRPLPARIFFLAKSVFLLVQAEH